MMVVNGLPLPASFVGFVRRPDLPYVWVLKDEVDAYGNAFESELLLHRDEVTIKTHTEGVRYTFEVLTKTTPEERQEWDVESADEPGFIPYLSDFSKIVAFGTGHEDHPFCFDFRGSPQEPSVIYWDDIYWRRVAPNFEAFIELFKPDDYPAKWSGATN
jgi:SMI1/KNR4 family protein SUKH-1